MNISDISKSFLDNIRDDNLKSLLIELLNLIEEQNQTITALKEEIQKLRDENNRLKGEQGRPDFGRKKKGVHPMLSSEKERKENKAWKKEGKKNKLIIDKEVKCELSQAALEKLPSDIRLLRYETRVQQNLKLVRENTRYLIAVYYSKSAKQTYHARLHSDCQGNFGSDLQTFIHVMTHVCDVTQSKLKLLLKTAGIEISRGSLNNILLRQAEMYESEKQAILQAGLTVGNYFGMDSTGSKQNGQRLYTQIINNEMLSVFSSHPRKSRLTILVALQGTQEALLPMSCNTEAKELLNDFGLSQHDKAAVDQLFEKDKVYTKAEVEQIIAQQLPTLKAKKNMFHRLLESMSIGFYHGQTTGSKVECLLTDDAGEYKMVAAVSHALCWVHDARFYKKLTPYVEAHRQILGDFTKQYWEYYHKLLAYKANPKENKVKELEKEFDRIFTARTDYFQLNQRMEKTHANKEKLLAVLKHPFIPLHNNASELGARRIVTKRKISLHTITNVGTKARDGAMSVVETCKKSGVNVINYIHDRISGEYKMPALADLILMNSS